MTEDKLKITYNGERDLITDSCPFWDYKVLDTERQYRERISGFGNCTHPLKKEKEIKCHYGESDIKVPENCPFREGELVFKIELMPS